MSANSTVLYTVLFGNYELLNELEIEKESEVDYICFTDSSKLTSDTWQIVQVIPTFPDDLVRSQRLIKIQGHDFLKGYERSLYIDNSVILQDRVTSILDSFLGTHEIAMPLHSFRETIQAEFDAVIQAELDSPDRLEEQFSHYRQSFSDVLEDKPLWTAIIARRINSSSANFFEQWANHVLRYSRRDQLSVRVAQLVTQQSIEEIDIDNHQTEWHKWPVAQLRRVEIRVFDEGTIYSKLKQECDAIFEYLKFKEALIDDIYQSTSWKITKPLRVFSTMIFLPKIKIRIEQWRKRHE